MSKVTRLERMRFSIVTKDLSHCFICHSFKNDLHEIYHGKNRINSMKYGCVIPVCRKCHNRIHKDVTTYSTTINGINYIGITFDEICKIKMQYDFLKTYPDLNFIDIFHYDYINGLQVKNKV